MSEEKGKVTYAQAVTTLIIMIGLAIFFTYGFMEGYKVEPLEERLYVVERSLASKTIEAGECEGFKTIRDHDGGNYTRETIYTNSPGEYNLSGNFTHYYSVCFINPSGVKGLNDLIQKPSYAQFVTR